MALLLGATVCISSWLLGEGGQQGVLMLTLRLLDWFIVV